MKIKLLLLMLLFSVVSWGQATLSVNETFSTVTTTGAPAMPTGFSHSGLTGYSGSLKFDTQGDWLQLYFTGVPGTLTFDIGVNNTYPGTLLSTITFTVEESTNGSVWTTLGIYTNVSGGTKTLNPNANSSYIRWIYTTKPSSYNIALKNIVLTASAGCTAASISTQPSITSQNLCQGVSATALSVGASGTGLTYQWYSNTNASNSGGTLIGAATAASYTPSTSVAGTLYYYCVATATCGAGAISNVSGGVTVTALPTTPSGTISGTTPACGSTILSFSGIATSPVVYYWQTTATGTSVTNNALSTLNVTASGNYYVRAVNGTCWSSSAVGPYAVTINTPLSITTQPTAQSVTAPATATFTVAATGTLVTYQWQVSTDSGGIWNNVSTGTGGTTVSYTTEATIIGMNGYQYRVIVSGMSPCVAVTSTAVTLTVNAAVIPVITSALTASGTTGTAFTYTIVATNTPTSYSATGLPAGLSINTITGVISGMPTAAGTSNVTITATNAGGTDTETLVITVATGPCLSETFESGATPSGWSTNSVIYGGQNCEGTQGLVFDAVGDYAITSAIANPETLTFLKKRSGTTTAWALTIQVSTSNLGPWTDVAIITLISGTCELETIDLSAYTFGTYYIKIIDSRATGTSQRTIDDLKVYCGTPCTPPATPLGTISGTTPACGSTVLSYSAPAAGLYWQTTAFGQLTTLPVTTPYTASVSGTYYVRHYDGSCWSSAVSYAVTVNTQHTITTQPINRVIEATANTTFAVTAAGTGLTYQWQVDTGSGFNNLTNTGVYTNVTNPTMNITGATLSMSGYLYRCVVSGAAPCTSVTSSSGSLTVNNAAPNNALNVATCYGNNNVSLSWTAATGSPDGYVVFALQSATAPATASPNDAGTYTANSDFSLASIVTPATLGKCVYKGAATTAAITGLTNGVNYSFTVVAYKGATQTGWATGVNTFGTWRITNTTIDMPEVSALAASVANTQSVVTWTNPTPLGCYDEYLVVANQGAVVFTPSGNGTAYTANTLYSGANQVVYKGTGATQTVTGLTNGLSYCYKVFVRRGTEWSDGVSVCQTPNIVYCTSSGNMSFQTSVTNVTLNSINNTTSTKTAGYMDFTGLSTNLQRNEDYPLSVNVNTDGIYTVLAFAWIDFNHDGDFTDAGEAFGLGSATGTAAGASNITTNASPLTITIPLTATLGATRMRVIATYDGDSSPCLTGFDGEVEDYTINIMTECLPTHSVTSIAPTSGPTATEVTIIGSGFTAGSTVTFNGIAATVVFVNSTTLTVTVPSGRTTGNVVVKEAGCKLVAGTFTEIKESGTCPSSSSLTDLIISEVYDSLAANSWYMELYNPTNNAIDLDAAGANYKLVRYGDIGTTTGIRTVDISGIIPPGGVYLADLGSESVCGALGFDFVAKANGINENDEIRLTKNDVTVDIVHCPNQKGYSIIRNLAAVGPSATYNGADWTLNTSESCANLGIVSFVFANTTPSVNTNPADVNVCGNTASFAITATANNSGALTYQWFYNNGAATGWTTLTTLAGLVITGETSDTLNLTGAIGTYNGYQFYCQVTESGTCSMASDAAQLKVSSTIWNGTVWSGGTPTLGMLTIIDGNYNTTTHGNIDCCSLQVNAGFTATITAGSYINIQNDLTVNTGGTLDVLNNGSLVQISDTGMNTGNIIMRRTANIKLQDYVYWSAPVSGFSVNSISPGTPSSLLWKWNPTVLNTNGGEGNWQSASGAMTVGGGYIVRAPNGYTNASATAFTANFTGVPNNGILTPAISRGNNLGAGTTGPNGVLRTENDDNWNLLGNPYPSAIGINEFLTANIANIDGFVRLWTHGTLPSSGTADPFYANFVSNYTAADYIAINGAGATSGPGTLSVIGAGQGFFVLMNAGGASTSSVTFNNAMRNKTFSNSQFYRAANILNDNQLIGGNLERHRIWLDLIPATGPTIRTLVAYVESATAGRDRLFDALTDYKSAQNFYSLIGNDVMTIQGRALPFVVEDKVPMGVKIPANGTYKIALAAVDGLFQGGAQIIYLEDKLLNVIHNLTASPYQFTANQGVINSRFILRYTNVTLGTDDFDTIGNNVIVASGNQEIHIESQMEPIKSIRVYDVLGRTIFEKNNVNTTEFSIQNLVLSQQALIVKIVLENGQTLTRKIIF